MYQSYTTPNLYMKNTCKVHCKVMDTLVPLCFKTAPELRLPRGKLNGLLFHSWQKVASPSCHEGGIQCPLAPAYRPPSCNVRPVEAHTGLQSVEFALNEVCWGAKNDWRGYRFRRRSKLYLEQD